MTAGLPPNEGGTDVEALIADRYLESVLAAGERGADGAPFDTALDPETRRAVALLRHALVRVHPSFRFEEALAGRLASFAASPDAVRDPGARVVLDFPSPAAGSGDPLLGAIMAGSLDPADDAALEIDSRLAGARKPLLVGGAITSAAISLVGVAWVAWRATRSTHRNANQPGGLDAVAGVLRGLG